MYFSSIVALAFSLDAVLALREEVQCQGGQPRQVHLLQAHHKLYIICQLLTTFAGASVHGVYFQEKRIVPGTAVAIGAHCTLERWVHVMQARSTILSRIQVKAL